MELFDSKRQERLAAAAKAATANKEAAKAFLIRQAYCYQVEKLHLICDKAMNESLSSRRSNLVIGFHGCANL